MQQLKKIVLAYSGGVDTSVCIPYLKNEYGIAEVVTFVADLGQGEDLELIRQKALNSGASKSIVGNLVNSFVENYAFPAIRANALYLEKYPLNPNETLLFFRVQLITYLISSCLYLLYFFEEFHIRQY